MGPTTFSDAKQVYRKHHNSFRGFTEMTRLAQNLSESGRKKMNELIALEKTRAKCEKQSFLWNFSEKNVLKFVHITCEEFWISSADFLKYQKNSLETVGLTRHAIKFENEYFFSAFLQATNYPNLSLTSHPNGTYSTGVVSSYGTSHQQQLASAHHSYSVPPTNITQTTLSSLPPYSSAPYHSTLGILTSAPQSVLPFSSVQSSYATTGSTYSTVGTNAFGTSGVTSGNYGICKMNSETHQNFQVSTFFYRPFFFLHKMKKNLNKNRIFSVRILSDPQQNFLTVVFFLRKINNKNKIVINSKLRSSGTNEVFHTTIFL